MKNIDIYNKLYIQATHSHKQDPFLVPNIPSFFPKNSIKTKTSVKHLNKDHPQPFITTELTYSSIQMLISRIPEKEVQEAAIAQYARWQSRKSVCFWTQSRDFAIKPLLLHGATLEQRANVNKELHKHKPNLIRQSVFIISLPNFK